MPTMTVEATAEDVPRRRLLVLSKFRVEHVRLKAYDDKLQ
jgi:hypothetical protein